MHPANPTNGRSPRVLLFNITFLKTTTYYSGLDRLRIVVKVPVSGFFVLRSITFAPAPSRKGLASIVVSMPFSIAAHTGDSPLYELLDLCDTTGRDLGLRLLDRFGMVLEFRYGCYSLKKAVQPAADATVELGGRELLPAASSTGRSSPQVCGMRVASNVNGADMTFHESLCGFTSLQGFSAFPAPSIKTRR